MFRESFEHSLGLRVQDGISQKHPVDDQFRHISLLCNTQQVTVGDAVSREHIEKIRLFPWEISRTIRLAHGSVPLVGHRDLSILIAS
jgi:hypothetical protein